MDPMYPDHEEKVEIGTHYFNEKENILYDLFKDTVMRLKIIRTVPNESGVDEIREYSIEELYIGVNKKIETLQKKKENVELQTVEKELVFVSFYGFLAVPGLAGLLTGFHNAWLQGFYIANLLKNLDLAITSSSTKMTDEERLFTQEKLREQGFEPYDPERHGSGEGPEVKGDTED